MNPMPDLQSIFRGNMEVQANTNIVLYLLENIESRILQNFQTAFQFESEALTLLSQW